MYSVTSVSMPLAGLPSASHCCIAAKEPQKLGETNQEVVALPLCRCVRCGSGHGQLIHVFVHWVS